MTKPILPDGGFEGYRADHSEVTYHVTDDKLPSQTVVRAVAAYTNTPILDLQPLVTVVDVDFLDEQFGGECPDMTLSFTYSDCEVTVSGDVVTVSEAST